VTTTTEPGAAPGLLPQQIAEATARLEAHLTRRCNPATAYHMRRKWARFVAFQTTCSDQPLFDQVQAWLSSLPGPQQRLHRIVLKVALGPAAVDWSTLVVTRYRRDEQRLARSVLREDGRAKVRAAARGPRELALIETLWTLRMHEAAALCWGDLDVTRGLVFVKKGKGNKPAWTMLPPSTRPALSAWFEAAGSPPDTAPVFPRPRGGHYAPKGIGRLVQKLLMRADLWARGIGAAHRFRRSFASQYLRQNRHDLVGLSRLMRHSQLATTNDYIFLEPDDFAPQMQALEL
jgi:integrase